MILRGLRRTHNYLTRIHFTALLCHGHFHRFISTDFRVVKQNKMWTFLNFASCHSTVSFLSYRYYVLVSSSFLNLKPIWLIKTRFCLLKKRMGRFWNQSNFLFKELLNFDQRPTRLNLIISLEKIIKHHFSSDFPSMSFVYYI